jgi:hypothetical protein
METARARRDEPVAVPSPSSGLFNDVWRYPLFEALYGRRSRRFGLGFEIGEGPFRYKSRRDPLPLSEIEEALLVAAGVGVTGTPLWDMARPPRSGAAGAGRTFGSTSGGQRTALFFTNDEGVHAIAPGAAATKVRQVATADEREQVLRLYREQRRTLSPGRLRIPRRVPPLFGHNLWDSNMPGATLFMPVSDVSQSVITLLLQLVDGEAGRYVARHGGGMCVVDDLRGFRPAGTEKWMKSGFLDRDKVLPLSVLERQACYFMFSEPAVICHNIFLATEALGLGGWMHCGFLSLGVLEALGFDVLGPGPGRSLPNPVGLRGVLEGYCPPYYPNMDAAVDAVVARLARKGPGGPDVPAQGPTPYSMPDDRYREALLDITDEGIACTKAICAYILETHGRFPATVDAMHLMWFMQAHHLDLEFYARHFKAGACGPTHLAHIETWHGGAASI